MAAGSQHLRKIVQNFLEEIQKLYRVDSATCSAPCQGDFEPVERYRSGIISSDFSEDLYEERLILMRLAAEIDDRIEQSLLGPETFIAIERWLTRLKKTPQIDLRIAKEYFMQSIRGQVSIID